MKKNFKPGKNAVWVAVLTLLVFGFPKIGSRKLAGVGFVLGAYTENAQAAQTSGAEKASEISSGKTGYSADSADSLNSGDALASQISAPMLGQGISAVTNSQQLSADISAKAAYVFDYHTGAVLYQKNALAKLPIASLTKLMTIAVAMQSPDFNKPITITAQDKLWQAPILDLKVGDSIMPEDLVKSMLVGSANDAALTIANHFAGDTGFLEQMNNMANSLGLTRTHYSTPIGFDVPGNYSTAEDISKIAKYALAHYPYSQIWKYKNFSFRSLDGNRYFISNSNALAGRPGIFSIKTGYTPQALGSMIVLAQTASGEKIVVTVLDSADRDGDVLKILDDFNLNKNSDSNTP